METGDLVRDPEHPEAGVFEYEEQRDKPVLGRLVLVETKGARSRARSAADQGLPIR
jgi:hypothetical protein